MAILGSNLRKQALERNENGGTIEQQLARLEDDIRRLKIDFDLYFTGGLKRPPHEARGRVESIIKRIADNRNVSFAQRFQFNTVVNRYTSFRELWRRKLKAKGEELI